MGKGVLLVACGHPYYTHMAYNLAMSIRYKSQIPITLAHNGNGLNYLFEDQKKIFNIIELPEKYFTEKGLFEPFKAKTFIYDLSPYEETLYLDCDMIFSPYKKADDIFEDLKECDLQFATRGEKQMTDTTRSEWIELMEVKEKYGFEHWYELSSEFIYFKKNKEVKQIFDDAKKLYSKHGLKINELFKCGTPDEVPFGLALEKNNYKIKPNYAPSYWQPAFYNKTKPDVEIWKNYYLLSVGGAHIQPNVKRMYDNIIKVYAGENGRVPYQLVAKSRIIKERAKI